MPVRWLPGVDRIEGNSAGGMNGDGSRKLLLHDTEGSTIAGAVAAYQANNSWPHLTVDCRRRQIVQHLPLDVAARSLRNMPGGADETNRDGTVLVQVEIVGFVNNRDGSMFGSREDYLWFGETIVGPICRDWAIPIRSTVTWTAYDASYGLDAPQRLSVAAWDAYSGVLGHEHAPDNTHGDPGAIDINLILAGADQEETEDMTPEEHELLEHIASAVVPAHQVNDGRYRIQTIMVPLFKDHITPSIARATADAVIERLPSGSVDAAVVRAACEDAVRAVFADAAVQG